MENKTVNRKCFSLIASGGDCLIRLKLRPTAMMIILLISSLVNSYISQFSAF